MLAELQRLNPNCVRASEKRIKGIRLDYITEKRETARQGLLGFPIPTLSFDNIRPCVSPNLCAGGTNARFSKLVHGLECDTDYNSQPVTLQHQRPKHRGSNR